MISIIILKDDSILCGWTDGTMCVFDYNLTRIKGLKTKNAITHLLFLNEHEFISCSIDKSIKVWNYWKEN